jgi:hypothetical protein
MEANPLAYRESNNSGLILDFSLHKDFMGGVHTLQTILS